MEFFKPFYQKLEQAIQKKQQEWIQTASTNEGSLELGKVNDDSSGEKEEDIQRLSGQALEWLAELLAVSPKEVVSVTIFPPKPADERALFTALTKNTTLKEFHFNYGYLGLVKMDRWAKQFFAMLKDNQTITQLDLSHTLIDSRGNYGELLTSQFATALEKNTTLKTLTLDHSGISGDRSRWLANMLKNNTTLTELNLRHNHMEDDDVKPFAEALRTNHTIAILGLSNNKMTDSGAKLFIETLQTNTPLTTLYLNGNQIQRTTKTAIAERLEKNLTNGAIKGLALCTPGSIKEGYVPTDVLYVFVEINKTDPTTRTVLNTLAKV